MPVDHRALGNWHEKKWIHYFSHLAKEEEEEETGQGGVEDDEGRGGAGAVMSLSPRTKLLALGQNAKRKATGQAVRPHPLLPPSSILFSLYATSLHCCCFSLLASGVCFYCMPRCLSFQKTSGHDEQQKQKETQKRAAVASGVEGLGGRSATQMDFGYCYCRCGWSRLPNFIALQWTAPCPNLVSKWNEINAKLDAHLFRN